MSKSRIGDMEKFVSQRSERVIEKAENQWFFKSRETGETGPFSTRRRAEMAIYHHIDRHLKSRSN